MNWIAIGLVLWLVWTGFFFGVWIFAFRAGRERGMIEGGQLGFQQGRLAERRDQALEPLILENQTFSALAHAQSGIGTVRNPE